MTAHAPTRSHLDARHRTSTIRMPGGICAPIKRVQSTRLAQSYSTQRVTWRPICRRVPICKPIPKLTVPCAAATLAAPTSSQTIVGGPSWSACTQRVIPKTAKQAKPTGQITSVTATSRAGSAPPHPISWPTARTRALARQGRTSWRALHMALVARCPPSAPFLTSILLHSPPLSLRYPDLTPT